MKQTAFLLLIAVLVAAVFARDPCPDAAKGTIVSYETAARCLRALELPSSVKKSTIDSMKKLIDVYIFEPMLKNPPNFIQDSYTDLQGRLAEIAEKPHNNDYDLQMDLRRMMASARDLHSTWHASTYTMVFLRAFPFVFVPRPNALAKHGFEFLLVGLPVVDLNQYTQATGIKIDEDKVKFQVVTSINGQEPMEFVGDWADEHVGARTARQRLLMAAYGGFSVGLMGSDFTEQKLSLDVELENGYRFTMDPIAVTEVDLHGKETLEQISPLNPYYQDEVHPFAAEREEAMQAMDDDYIKFVKRTFGRMMQFSEETTHEEVITSAFKGNRDVAELYKGPDMALFHHAETNTCIWKLDTFAPEKIAQWVKDILNIADLVVEKQCDTNGHLILDERANGGGMVTLASSLWALLVGYENLWPVINSRIRYRYDDTEIHLHRDIEWNEYTATPYEMKPYDSYAINPENVRELGTKLTPVSWYRDQIFNPMNKAEIVRQLENDYSLPEDMREAFLLVLRRIVDQPSPMKLNNQNFAILTGAMSASCSAFTATRMYDSSYAKVVDVGPRNERFPSSQLALVPGSDTVGIDQILDNDYLRPLPRGASASFGNMGAFPIYADTGRKIGASDSDVYTYAFSDRQSHATLDIMNTVLPIDGAYAGTPQDLLNVISEFERKNIWTRCFENQYTEQHEVNGAIVGKVCNPKTGQFTEKEEFIRCSFSTKPTGRKVNGLPTCKHVDIFYVTRRMAFASAGAVAGVSGVVLSVAAAIIIGVQRSRKAVLSYTAI